jgi:hypothetical protein
MLSCPPSLVPMSLKNIIMGHSSVSFLPTFGSRTMMTRQCKTFSCVFCFSPDVQEPRPSPLIRPNQSKYGQAAAVYSAVFPEPCYLLNAVLELSADEVDPISIFRYARCRLCGMCCLPCCAILGGIWKLRYTTLSPHQNCGVNYGPEGRVKKTCY